MNPWRAINPGAVLSCLALCLPFTALAQYDPYLLNSPVSRTVQLGDTASFNVNVQGTPPLIYQWRKDGTNLLVTTDYSLTLTNVQWNNHGDYDVIVTNSSGSVTSAVATLSVNLTTADSFNPVLNDRVRALTFQPDGKILIGGDFAGKLARLHANGTVDSFSAPADDAVRCLAMTADSGFVLGGDFSRLGNLPCSMIGRFSSGGWQDPTFASSASGSVSSLAVQPDGKIIVGGYFTRLTGTNYSYLGRINADGSLDSTFNAGINGYVDCVALQPDGRIVVGGSFTSAGGAAHTNLVRLETNGLPDASFNAGTDFQPLCLVVQKDGKILAGGMFRTVSGQERNNLARLNANGSLDASFNPGVSHPNFFTATVYALALQSDGRIVVGGIFDTLAGMKRNGLGRLYPDGSPDPTMNATASTDLAWIYALGIQTDGKILAGGTFSFMAGQSRPYLARLNNSEPATGQLSFDASSITWLRGGTGPEILRASFAYTTDNWTWTDLGDGTRIAGGWQLTGHSPPPGAVLRARGFVSAGGWFEELLAGPPLLLAADRHRTNYAGTTANFSVYPLPGITQNYQWLKDGTPLADSTKFSGATSSWLMISNVFKADESGYSCILSNAYGVVTSAVANLTVIEPWISAPPLLKEASLGQSAAFSATAIGTAPLVYQWFKNGVEINSATTPTLTLTNLQATDAGNYSVSVSNAYGRTTSSVAPLVLNLAVPDTFVTGANDQVSALALQADGKILVGGSFNRLGGQPRVCLGRLLPDGTVDSFNPSLTIGSSNAYLAVGSLIVQSDGKIVVGGSRGPIEQAHSPNLVWRLNGSGAEDTNFASSLRGTINIIAAQPDGKILVGGIFFTPQLAITTNLARLLANGSLDSNFTATANAAVNTLALQPDGKIIVGGAFTSFAGLSRNRLARLNSDGTLDSSFNPNANNTVNALLLQPDGKILVGGTFTTLAGTNRNRIARIKADGTIDASFNPNANSTVATLSLVANGKILIGGSFTNVGGLTRNRLARLNADGSPDTTFNPGANNQVNAFAIQPDGSILVGGGTLAGGLSLLGGQSRTNMGRLVGTEPTTEQLTFNGATATWLRSGPGAEFWRTTFEGSTNGADWTTLGDGTWITNGWQLTGATFPLRAMIRARGFTASGINSGSGWFSEVISPSAIPPLMVPSPGSSPVRIAALPGQVLVMEATTDLTHWIPLQTNTVTSSGELIFSDVEAASYPQRFYRARVLP